MVNFSSSKHVVNAHRDKFPWLFCSAGSVCSSVICVGWAAQCERTDSSLTINLLTIGLLKYSPLVLRIFWKMELERNRKENCTQTSSSLLSTITEEQLREVASKRRGIDTFYPQCLWDSSVSEVCHVRAGLHHQEVPALNSAKELDQV